MIWLAAALAGIGAATVLLWPLRPKRLMFLCGVFCFASAALALYAYLGAPLLLPQLAQHRAETAALETRINVAQSALKQDAENIGAWAELGQALMERGAFSQSAEAYKRAVLLSGGHPPLILQYAKAQIFEANGNVTEAARRGLLIVRSADPRNPEAQYFLALADAQDGKPEKAMPVFKKLYRTLPQDSPIRQLLARQIGVK